MILKNLFEDHIDSLLFTNLSIGGSIATDKQWTQIISLLHSQYKFTVTKDTFAGTFYPGMLVKPKTSGGIKTGDNVLYYVTYDGEHNQDAAVFKMLSVANKVGREFYGTIYPDIIHMLIYTSTKSDKVDTGIIAIPKRLHTEEFAQLWHALYRYTISSHTRQGYINFLENLTL